MQKYTAALSIALLLSGFSLSGMYHYRPLKNSNEDLESVRLLEEVYSKYADDRPFNKIEIMAMRNVFEENGAKQTILSHAKRQTSLSFEFASFLVRMGVTDPSEQESSIPNIQVNEIQEVS